MSDQFNLQRFVDAQNPIYGSIVKELKSGRKQGHWMWFVFPQIAGLGASAMSQTYAIGSREEARAYAAHPILGPRLVECTRLVIAAQNRSIDAILPYPDNLKFHSCMTLFQECAPGTECYCEALEHYFAGEPDAATLDILQRMRWGAS